MIQKEIERYHTKLRGLNPIDRLVFTIFSIMNFERDNVHTQLSDMYNNDKGLGEQKLLLDAIFDNLEDSIKCREFFDDIIYRTLHKIYYMYCLDNEKILSDTECIILQDDNLCFISPFLFPKKLWKEIIKHDFYVLNLKKHNIDKIKRKVLGLIRDIPFRTSSNQIWDIWSGDLNQTDPIIYHANKSCFKIKLSEYDDFVRNLDKKDYNEYIEGGSSTQENMEWRRNFKIIISSDYKQNQILSLLNSFCKKWMPVQNIKFNNFIVRFCVYENKMPENYYLSSDLVNENRNEKLTKEEFEDIICLFKYLKENNVLLNKRINSNRKIAEILLDYFSFNEFGFESTRDKLSNKSSLSLSKEIKTDLNYFLISTQS